MTDLPDERTAPARRRTADGTADGAAEAGGADDVEATMISMRGFRPGGGATEPADAGETAPPGPRRSGEPSDADGELDPDEGSTIVARRESRRRASRAVEADAIPLDGEDATVVVSTARGRSLPSTLAGDVPAQLGRVARAPMAGAETYPPRSPQPVVAARSAPPAHAVQRPADTAAAERAAATRSRRRLVFVVVAAVVVVVIATTAIVILSTL